MNNCNYHKNCFQVRYGEKDCDIKDKLECYLYWGHRENEVAAELRCIEETREKLTLAKMIEKRQEIFGPKKS